MDKRKVIAIAAFVICIIGILVVLYPGWATHKLCSDKIKADYDTLIVEEYGGQMEEWSNQIVRKMYLNAYIYGDVKQCLCYVVKSGDTGKWYASQISCQ